MTIIAKPIREKGLEKPLTSDIIDFPSDVNLTHKNDLPPMELWLSPSVRRRISTTRTVCTFITALIVMSSGIIGGVYLYRHMTQRQLAGFKGWCGIPYEKDNLHFSHKNSILGPNRPFFKDNYADWKVPHNTFREELDLDLSSGLFMKISVPDIGYGMRVHFLHDFGSNKTGIVLPDEKKCHVLMLDRINTNPPRDVFTYVQNMRNGEGSKTSGVIYKRMTIIRPAISNLSVHGQLIERFCSGFSTFMLQEQRGRRHVRSVKKIQRMAEFAGKNIIEFAIEDTE